MSNGETLPTKHFLFKWLPWIDQDGLMRINTRLSDNKDNREIFGYDKIFPIVLPSNHVVTNFYILDFHRKNKHLFAKNVMSLLKSRFFLEHAKSKIKSVIKQPIKPTKQQKIKLVRVPIIKANSIVLDEAANLDQEIKMLTTIKSKKVIAPGG